MTVRRLLLDASPGERRGVVLLNGQPERLLIERDGEPLRPRSGEIWRGRLRSISRTFRGGFVDLGLGRDGLMKLDAGSALTEGAALEVEVLGEGRADKGPTLRLIGPAAGDPARLTTAASVEVRLQTFAPGARIETGEIAREAADMAEETALATRHVLSRGPVLTMEATRGLVAVDLDFGEAHAKGRGVLDANLLGVREAARLTRLKALAGLVVIDLVGPAREHAQLLEAARSAFAPDDPGVVIAGVSRLGVLEVARPWRERPVAEALCDRDGRLSARTIAQRALRQLEAEGRADPGARLQLICAPEVADEAAALVTQLGPRFAVAAEVGRSRLDTDIRKP